MCRARKRQAVGDDIGAALFDRPNMRGIDFRTTAAIYQAKPRDGASFAVSPQYGPAKDAIPDNSRRQVADALSCLLKCEWRLLLSQTGHSQWFANSRKYRSILTKPQPYNAIEIIHRERPNRRLSASGNPSVLVEYAALNHAVVAVERYQVGKIQIAAGLDQREVHTLRLGIRNDFFNLRHGEVATTFGNFDRLVVDDPVTNACFCSSEILPRKLVTLGRPVVVDGIRTMNENAEAHFLCHPTE